MYRKTLDILGYGVRSKRSMRVETYHALADLVSRNESQREEAITILNTIIKIEPEEMKSYKMQAKLLIKLNRIQQMRSMFDKAFQQFPQNLELMFYAAEACMLLGDKDCAEGHYRKILNLEKRQGLAMFHYGEIIASKEFATNDELITAQK